MSLEEKLAEIRKLGYERIPPAVLTTMHAATAALRNSGILEGVVKPGATLPSLALANSAGTTIRSGDLLARGPEVLTVFRRHW